MSDERGLRPRWRSRPFIARDPGLQEDRPAEPLGQLDLDPHRVAGLDHVAELDVVRPRRHRDLARLITHELRQQHGAGLHARLAEDHAWRDREVGVVAAEPELVAGEPLAADDPRLVLLDDLVDQEEGLPVRDGGFDGF